MPKVSIVVPVWNIEKYIKECLDSLVNQTFDDYEILVINDGSEDNSQKIIDEYTKKYEKVKSYIKENGGLSDARNYGMSHAIGEYIIFVDGDDWIKKDTIEVLYQEIKKNESDIAIYNFEECYEDGKCNITKEIDESIEDIQKAYMIALPSFCNKMFRREFLKEINFSFIKGIYYEDLAIHPVVAAQTNKIVYIDKPFYNYRIRQGSIMKQQEKNPKLFDIFKVFEYIQQGMKKIEKEDEFHDEIEYIYIKHLLHAASLRFIVFKGEDETIGKISDIMKEKFPNWRKNKYYKKQPLKYKIVCNLIYLKKLNLLRKILK